MLATIILSLSDRKNIIFSFYIFCLGLIVGKKWSKFTVRK